MLTLEDSCEGKIQSGDSSHHYWALDKNALNE